MVVHDQELVRRLELEDVLSHVPGAETIATRERLHLRLGEMPTLFGFDGHRQSVAARPSGPIDARNARADQNAFTSNS